MEIAAVRSSQVIEHPRCIDTCTPALRVRELSKRYGTNLALSPVNLDFTPGRVHVLFGENGAGKSTLISMIAGANEPTSGTIEIGTHCGSFRSVSEARAHGVADPARDMELLAREMGQAAGVGDVLAGDHRRAAVNGLEHGRAQADVG